MKKVLSPVRANDHLVVTKLDRLASSIGEDHYIANELAEKGVALSVGGCAYDPTGKPLFNALKMVVEFEACAIRMRTRKGKQVAWADGHLRGKKPKLSPVHEKHRAALYRSGERTTTECAGSQR